MSVEALFREEFEVGWGAGSYSPLLSRKAPVRAAEAERVGQRVADLRCALRDSARSRGRTPGSGVSWLMVGGIIRA